tara:strand:- start:18 stop:314 length:297 start_codon:yes stop_codon:yes gene_type:complete
VRKAGENCSCDKESDVFQLIWEHLRKDGLDDQAANHMAAEMLTHGEDFDSSVDKYFRNLANFKEKGFNKHAAQAMAVEALETGNDPAESIRFARIHLG